ncbi:MAG TPA: PfkB family carbohydrate kinase [Verrucomicrobiae bacterium]|jgi:D-beta-D-heptose 7-phosphate kinase/D-beta-D-heptose 1-phosphate adenosyltransferase|nr:PfkB family carbohydrate kinase [Verrucomicrobiae bacterium]
MTQARLTVARVRELLGQASCRRIVVLGDVMLDQFLWGHVRRISPEAPVPVLDWQRESFIPGGAANVARNLASLDVPTELLGVVGPDHSADKLKELLKRDRIKCSGLLTIAGRITSLKTRIVAHRQQVVRVDKESRVELGQDVTRQLLRALEKSLKCADAVVIGDYAKGVVTQPLIEGARKLCRDRGIWLSVDPKPAHHLDLASVSLLTPNRKEAFELADMADSSDGPAPLEDKPLLTVADKLLRQLAPAVLLITLGEQGLLLCRRGREPFHIPTVAREVFDVSGAGDTTIASFTLAIVAGASPVEAAIFSNHAAGVVVGKVGTAVVHPEELIQSFRHEQA